MGVDMRIPSVYDTGKGARLYTKIYQTTYCNEKWVKQRETCLCDHRETADAQESTLGKEKENGQFIGRRMENHEPALGA